MVQGTVGERLERLKRYTFKGGYVPKVLDFSIQNKYTEYLFCPGHHSMGGIHNSYHDPCLNGT